MNILLILTYIKKQLNKNIFILISIVFLILLLKSCARPTSPTGGEKDETYPILLFSYPEKNEVNFNDNMIVLDFDEWVKTNQLNKELIITPRMNSKYKTKYKKKSVTLYDLALDKKTTYTFNFRKGIVDLTEKNPAEDLSITFSTGKKIDSTVISGMVKNTTRNKSKYLAIGLYDDIDSLNMFNSEAKYLVETDSLYQFKFNYIKPDIYKIYAFSDYNRNGKCESKKESYAFLTEKIDARKGSVDSLIMRLTKNFINPIKIIGGKRKPNVFEVTFSKSTDTVLVDIDENDSLIYQMSSEKDKLLFYNLKKDTLEHKISLKVIDSVKNEADTTLIAKFTYSKKRKTDYTLKSKSELIDEKRLMKAKFIFNKPTYINPLDSIGYYLDSTKIADLKDITKQWNNNKTELNIEYKLDIDSLFLKFEKVDEIDTVKKKIIEPRLQFYAPEKSFVSLLQDSSENQSIIFNIVNLDRVSSISGAFECDIEDKIFELVRDNKIIRKTIKSKEFQYKYLKSGEYYFQYYIDKNKNKKLDLGNFNKNELPEEMVVLNNNKIELKEGWALEKQKIQCVNQEIEVEEE